MKNLYPSFLFIFCCLTASAQSFEGTLTYKVDFEVKTTKFGDFEITEEQVIEKMKKDGEYFDTITITIKNGNYLKQDNSPSQKKVVYKPDLNKIYTFQKDFEYVVITDANKVNAMNLNFEQPAIEKTDSAIPVYNTTCKLLTLTWGKLGSEQYYYNPAVAKLNAELFRQHNFEYLNTILAITNAYPLKIVKSLSDFVSVTITAVNISEHPVDDTLFALPEFKKAEKDYAEMMKKITGSEVMKIKGQ